MAAFIWEGDFVKRYYLSEFENEYIYKTLASVGINYWCIPAYFHSVVPAQQVFKLISAKFIEFCEKQNKERDREMERNIGYDYTTRFLYVLYSRSHFLAQFCQMLSQYWGMFHLLYSI
jgi:hypothetical protein